MLLNGLATRDMPEQLSEFSPVARDLLRAFATKALQMTRLTVSREL